MYVTYIFNGRMIKVELIIFNSIEEDCCVRAILERDNTEILRNIISFAETEGVTESSIREYIAVLLANDDNIISRLAQSGRKIGDELLSGDFPKSLRKHRKRTILFVIPTVSACRFAFSKRFLPKLQRALG